MELARSWFTSSSPIVPKEFGALLNSHSLTRGVKIESGQPELVTPLPERGEGRNHDLVLIGKRRGLSVTICVEAKVDEPFGNQTVGGYWLEARKKRDRIKNPVTSKAPERIESLLRIVFGNSAKPDHDPWSGIRYQLLAAIAGTVLQAEQAGSFFAVFAVHEFHTDAIDGDRALENTSAFEHLVRVLTGHHELKVEPGKLYGPIRIFANQYLHKDKELLVGKAVSVWRVPYRTCSK
ncbi:MAG: hypothetical protein A2W28_06600 [Gammaproteobacteria bacterium RBG_16_51_14]|nr:MAG: hypothetical protein A2W28_06600 [Gammaproteobacteria bacterium RBG_16_51_14]